MKISPAVKVGILTILSLIILTFGIMWIKGRAISTGHRIEIRFRDVDGMRPGSAVQMMGLRIGQVEDVIPVINNENSYVKVKFVITEQGVEIPHASEISIQQSGVIGEKFIEITPPKIKTVYLPTKLTSRLELKLNDPVELLIDGKYVSVGKIKKVEVVDTKTLSFSQQAELASRYAYKIDYIVTMAGLIIPEGGLAKVKSDKLVLTPPDNIIVQLPEVFSEYTIIEPVRLKDFLDLQLKAATSLTETNEKINTMMGGETIDDIKTTLKNIKTLSAKANDIFDKTQLLIETSRKELQSTIVLASKLTTKVSVLSDNINSIIGNPEFKTTLVSSTKSINESTKKISDILNDTKTQQTLEYINTTTKNLSELSTCLNNMSKDKDLKIQLDKTITNLNKSLDSMEKLTETMESVKTLTTSEEGNVKDILNDAHETAKNLKIFSEKLNKRFLLFRMMF